MNDILDDGLVESQSNKTNRINMVSILIWVSIWLIGYWFRVMHWPGGLLFMIIGASGFMGNTANNFFLVRTNNTFNNLFGILSFVWIFVVVWGVISQSGFFLSEAGIVLHSVLLIVIFLVYRAVFLFFIGKKKKQLDI